jgi:alanine dehydrogenase
MRDQSLTLGVVGTSNKENEFRLPIHPDHLPRLDPALQPRVFVEEGYGSRFGVDRTYLAEHVAGIMSREALFEHCDVILLPKPTEADLFLFRDGQILWGWPHCVQDPAITQVGIDKRMTFIAWEAMYSWKKGEVPELHTFYKNNELAGYCSVLHSLQLTGITGHYGAPRRVAIISFGSTARGAVYALRGQGFTEIRVYTQRPPYAVQNQLPSIRYHQIRRVAPESAGLVVERSGGQAIPFAEELGNFDIIVNCVLQDTNRPLMYIQGEEANRLKPGTLIIDVSCDYGMGFDFARPTSFEAPAFEVGRGVTYYAVDHSPSYLWNAATHEISAALLPYIGTVLGGEGAWQQDTTIQKAIEIKNGVILNPKILSFQKRATEYPHPVLDP